MLSEIHFYLKGDRYGWLSNFAPYPIVIDGVTWPTSEHFYQASKFVDDPAWSDSIRAVTRPFDAWRMGRHPDHCCRSDWNQIRDEVMQRAVFTKFSQHASLRQRLLETGHAVLVERNPSDHYWGDGGDGSGQNQLGQILMRVRETLREATAKKG
ncbi:MAG: NADAR family protein [Planctomycetota bacterium]